jgi:hypothetical protein
VVWEEAGSECERMQMKQATFKTPAELQDVLGWLTKHNDGILCFHFILMGQKQAKITKCKIGGSTANDFVINIVSIYDDKWV